MAHLLEQRSMVKSMMPTNAIRAEWAEQALTIFTNNVSYGLSPAELEPGDRADAVADLICNLLLYSIEQGFSPESLLTQAMINFEYEHAKEGS